MELKIPFPEYKSGIIRFKEELENLAVSQIEEDEELQTAQSQLKDIKKRCSEYIMNSLSPDIARELSNEILNENRFHIPNQSLPFSQKKKNFINRVKDRMPITDFLIQAVQLGDPLMDGRSFEVERADLSIQEKQDFLLSKLYDLRKTNQYWDVEMIFRYNQVALDFHNEARDIVKTLENMEYVEIYGYGSIVAAKITVDGKAYYEEYIKPKLTQGSPLETYDVSEFEEQIKNLENELREQMDVMQEKIEELVEELNSAKKYIDKMDKKSFSQLIKGKIVEVVTEKTFSKEALHLIGKTLFHELPKLLNS